MKRLYLIQAQATIGMGNEMYIPYSVGCIWSYANQFDDIQKNIELVDIIFRRDLHSKVIDKMHEPDIVGFSTYVWNTLWNLKLAEKIKELWPNCKIVFGGAAVESSWTKYKFIDSLIFTEGEIAFTKVLRDLINNRPLEIFYPGERVVDLEVPSPYTSGVFDKMIKENPEIDWFMIFETTRGCPYSCTFCDWGGGIYTKTRKFPIDKIRKEIEWASKNPIVRLSNVDANFGMFKDRDLEITKFIRDVIADPTNKLEMIQNTYAKNTNEFCFEIEKELGRYTYGMTISVQSMNPDVLEAIKRKNMKINDLERMFALSKQYNVRSYTELILGLPQETKESFISGLTQLLELGQHEYIYVWLLSVISTAEMGNADYRKRYGIKTVLAKDVLQNPVEAENDRIDNTTELVEMVRETNTMSTQDIIDCNLYTWMISQFHLTGISEFVSKYCRSVLNISYKDFYNTLFKVLYQDEKAKEVMTEFNNIMVSYFATGEVPLDYQNVVAWTLPISFKADYIYSNREYFIDVVLNVAKELSNMSKEQELELHTLQHSYFYNPNKIYPYEITVGVDIENWEGTPTTYIIDQRTTNNKHQVSSFGQAFERWLKKTEITKL
jgi:radical SAM superfamily enzyme YgiQ (UPF0313 family)